MTPTLISSFAGAVHRELVFSMADGIATYGPFVEFRPLAEDVNSFLTDRAAILAQTLVDGEIANNVQQVITLGSLASPSLRYSTAAANFAALRVAYQTATRIEAVMIGDFLNTLTNAQLAAAFGITTGQAATLRTNKLAPAASLATSIRASMGQ